MQNILDTLSDRNRPWAQPILRRSYQAAAQKLAQRRRLDLATLEPPLNFNSQGTSPAGSGAGFVGLGRHLVLEQPERRQLRRWPR
jgi:hypothetical protein